MNSKVLAFAFSFCMVTLPTYAANWVYVGENTSGNIYFIDKSSLQKDRNSVTFWYKVNFKQRSSQGDLSEKNQYTFNCHRREMIFRYITTYDDIDNGGRNTSSFVPRDKWEPIIPETVTWAMMMFVCR